MNDVVALRSFSRLTRLGLILLILFVPGFAVIRDSRQEVKRIMREGVGMSYGPIELLAVRFPGNRFTGELTPALGELVESGTIRIIDLLFVSKDADGSVLIAELDELGDGVVTALDPYIAESAGLLSEDDAIRFATALEPNTSEALLVFENAWASRFAQAVRNAHGELIFNERIPRAVVDAMLAYERDEGIASN